MIFFEYRLGALFMIGVGVAVEKQNSAGLDAEFLQLDAKRRDLLIVERGVDLAVREHPLVDFETQRPFDQRHMLAEKQVIGVRPVDASDLVDVAETLGDQQRRARTGALQHRVNGNRGAVQKQRRRTIVAASLGDARGNTFDQMRRRRQRLAEGQLPGFFVKDGNIRKGTADIRGKPQPSPRRLSLHHAALAPSPYASSTT